ncbi:hypothetical protein [Methylogaea oryzae]|nr:hypothetical protein [Methylogaea oryzae]
MNDRFRHPGDRPKLDGKNLLKLIVGLAAMELCFFLFRQGAGWFLNQPSP